MDNNKSYEYINTKKGIEIAKCLTNEDEVEHDHIAFQIESCDI